jgi:hypothetical protein
MRYLKQNTATRVTVGPFLDVADAKTPELALTVTGCLVTFVVDDGGVPTLVIDAAPTASGGNNDMVHITSDAAGYYDLELTAAQTNYVGRAVLCINDDDVHLPVFHEFMILPANVYDSWMGTDTLDVNVTSMAANVLTASAINADALTAAKVADDVGEQFADQLLNRNLATGTDSGSATVRTVRQALRFLRNKWSISGTTLTVTKEDDSTASWTSELTTSGAADPVTGSDPASA